MARSNGKFKFSVNGQHFETDQQYLTGTQIKTIAHLDLALQLFLEEPGADKPDSQIQNDQSVDLGEPGIEKFYTVPVATFGRE